MNNFNLYVPTRVLFGQGQIASLAKQVPAGARVLVTYGGGSVLANGVMAQVRAACWPCSSVMSSPKRPLMRPSGAALTWPEMNSSLPVITNGT